ncbi:TolC family protein [Candidatus Dependentiae bacterium]|nr:TolC family protein [Candidatus Dependentiae bacterium]
MKIFIAIILLLLSGCAKVKIGSEFAKLEKKTVKLTGSNIVLDNVLHDELEDIPNIKNKIADGLSRDQAVSIALLNNPSLQADFENLGIAKADLVQAGLFTNPTTNNVFRFPTRSQGPGTAQTNIESVLAFRLSDMWLVPVSKKVAEDLLEIVSLRILSTILTTVEDTKIAYDACLASEQQLENTKNLLDATKELKNEIYYRQLYGYTSDLDKNLVDASLGVLETELEQRQYDVLNSYIHLKKLLGINPSSEQIKLTSKLNEINAIPEIKLLEEYALTNRPEIQIAHMKIRQYKDSISLERARLFKDVNIGITYKQDFDKPFRGWGPYISFEIPFFDSNYAQVAKAEFHLRQAEKEVLEEKIKIKEEIRKPYNVINALKKEINFYESKIIPAHEKAIDYAYTYAATMQLNMVTAYETTIKFYEANAELIDKYFELRTKFAQLERAVGKNIDNFATEASMKNIKFIN